MEIFNAGADKFSIGFEEGGVPYYNTDVLNSQDNAQLWGIPSMYRDYNIILSGCKVDELNLSTTTIKIQEGYALIQNLVYKVPAYNGTYPVELKVSDPVVEQRDFKSGETHDATLKYTISWVTTLTTATATNHPIQFKPFSNQRLESFQNNMGKVQGEIRELYITSTNRKKTDTGKTIQGGSVPLADSGMFAGWTQVISNNVTVGYDPANTVRTLGFEFGLNNSLLNSLHLPAHRHETNNGVNGSTTKVDTVADHNHKVDLQTNVNGVHHHDFSRSGDNTLDHSGHYPLLRQNGDVTVYPNYGGNSNAGMRDAGSHTHDVAGLTQDAGGHTHSVSGMTGEGEWTVSSQTPYQRTQPSVVVLRLKYVGMAEMFNHVQFYSDLF